jgi:hypothetical protein
MGVVVNHSIQTQLVDADSNTNYDVQYTFTDSVTNADALTQKLLLTTTEVTIFTVGARAAGATYTNYKNIVIKNLSTTETAYINFADTGAFVIAYAIPPGKVMCLPAPLIYANVGGTTSISAAAFTSIDIVRGGASGDCLVEVSIIASR